MKTRNHKLLSNNKGDRRSGKSSDSRTVSLLSFVFASRCCNLKACSNEANMLVQHHTTLLDATCWPRLNRPLDYNSVMQTQKKSKVTVLESDDFPLRRSPLLFDNNL